MPVINVQPRNMQDGTSITYFYDSVGTSETTYTFLTNQEAITLRNKGSKDLNYTIGGNTGVLSQGEVIKVTGTFSSLVLSSSQGTQAFEIIADEVGSVLGNVIGGGGNANIDDTTTAADKVWSSQKTQTQIQAIPKGDKGDKGDPGAGLLTINTVDFPHFTNLKDTNLYNVADQVAPNIIDNAYLGGPGVTQYTNSNYFISSKIPVYPGLTLTVSDINSAAGVGAFYGSNDVAISLISADTFTVPSGCAYIRLSVLKSRPWQTAMLVIGSTLPGTFVPYGAKINWLKVGSENLDKGSVTNNNVGLRALDTDSISKAGVRILNIKGSTNLNLYNPADQVAPNIIDGMFIGGGGTNYVNANYRISSKIHIIPGATYTVSDINSAASVGAFYTRDDVVISEITTDTFTAPSNASYLRLSVDKSKTNIMLVEGSSLPSIFVPYGAELDWLRFNSAQLAIAGNRWAGKKANFMGDSIFQGNQTPGTPIPDLVGQYLGLSVVRNYAISGTTLGEGTGSVNPMTLRVAAMDNDADINIWSGGTNDAAFINNLGTAADTSPTSYYGALYTMLNSLINKYPDKLNIGVTLPQRATGGVGSGLENYAKAMVEMCYKFGMPCIDAFHNFGMNPTIAAQNTAYYGDGVHHNAYGKQVYAAKLAGFIRTQ